MSHSSRGRPRKEKRSVSQSESQDSRETPPRTTSAIPTPIVFAELIRHVRYARCTLCGVDISACRTRRSEVPFCSSDKALDNLQASNMEEPICHCHHHRRSYCCRGRQRVRRVNFSERPCPMCKLVLWYKLLECTRSGEDNKQFSE
jgi:hypothetical protein